MGAHHDVPQPLIPPSQFHNIYARRVTELGLGIRLSPSDFSPNTLRATAVALLHNQLIRIEFARYSAI
jgi:UDP:flavonoid glycosyltransferase YjiC (YdhE family)